MFRVDRDMVGVAVGEHRGWWQLLWLLYELAGIWIFVEGSAKLIGPLGGGSVISDQSNGNYTSQETLPTRRRLDPAAASATPARLLTQDPLGRCPCSRGIPCWPDAARGYQSGSRD
jgi:hypothetical protein